MTQGQLSRHPTFSLKNAGLSIHMTTGEQIHATCVSIENQGVIIRGASGSGKSDLALRLIDQGGDLVADDRVDLINEDGQLFAMSPEEIAGLLEVRGIGVIRQDFVEKIAVCLIVDLVDSQDVPRLPETKTTEVLGFVVHHVRLNAFSASTPAKIRLALRTGDEAMVEATWQTS